MNFCSECCSQIKRKTEPYKGLWTVPSGYILENETSQAAEIPYDKLASPEVINNVEEFCTLR